MNTWAAFAMGEANRGKEMMVFDWDKAARLIGERKPECASAGLLVFGAIGNTLVGQSTRMESR